MKRLGFFLTAICIGCALGLLVSRTAYDPNWAARLVVSMLQA
jgi:hypothetical protein